MTTLSELHKCVFLHMRIETWHLGLVTGFTEKQLLCWLENIVSDSLQENNWFDLISKEQYTYWNRRKAIDIFFYWIDMGTKRIG